MDSKYEVYEILSSGGWKFNVKVQGKRSSNEVVILTVHDLGCNYLQYETFIQSPKMEAFNQRCVWVHVDMPGHDINDEEFTGDYPTLQDVADNLIKVVEELNIKQCVLFGEGAGGNILARFAMDHNELILGTVLIHVTGSSASLMENLKEKITNRKMSTGELTSTTQSYLVLHRYGVYKENKKDEELSTMIKDYKGNLHSINAVNVHKYVRSFMARKPITERAGHLKCPVLLVTGTLASQNSSMNTFADHLKTARKDKPELRAKVELLSVEGAANVLQERPEKLAESFQYFMQGLGLLVMPNLDSVEQEVETTSEVRKRGLSMAECDAPRGPDSLVHQDQRKYSVQTKVAD